jgi:C4-dicarboxylate-specific signal transduction histidine kinase
MAAAIAFTAATVSAQEPAEQQGHKYMAPHASRHVDVTARVGRLDERIAMLTADMRMFAGELKIQVMGELIEALIERQHLMESQMRQMHETMGEWMPHATQPVSPGAVPEPEEMEPEAMCSPFN